MAGRRKAGVSTSAFRVRYLRRSRQLYRRFLESKPWVREFYKSFLGLKPGLRIVEVGCGTGDLTRYLAELVGGKCSIIGVDMRAASLRTAEAEARKAGFADRISYRKGDAYNVPVDDGYADLACCRTLLMHLTDPGKAVKEMARVTRRGGTVAALERGWIHSFYDPEDEKFNMLVEKMGEAFLRGVRKLEGKDFAIGEKLPTIFQKAGLGQIKAEIQADAWVNCDSRSKLRDLKDWLKFDLEVFKERKKVERKVMLAGGASRSDVNRVFQRYVSRSLRLLRDDEMLRNDTLFSASARVVVTGQKA
jgi:ubiquinone/menaquinone biosynthesis C-methylase UbiE